MTPEVIDALLAAGVTADQLAAAVKADMAAEERRKAEKRAKAAEKKRRQRAAMSPACPRDASGQAGTDGDTPSLPSSPHTPQQPTHPRGDISSAREGPSRADVAKGFVAFWSAYPRKVGKDAAAKAFERAMRRAEGPDPLETILAGLRRAIPGWDDPTFIPHPSTWLNQGRWTDEEPRAPYDRPANDHPRPASVGQRSRAERDQSAALEVLARRGSLPRPSEAGGVHGGPASGAASA